MTDPKQITQSNPDKDPKVVDSPDSPEDLSDLEIVNILNGYYIEGDMARSSGSGARDDIWKDNIDLYWSRFDFSDKAEWQATEVLPEAPQFVNRFASAMREALNRDGEFYTVDDPTDPNNTLSPAINKFMDVLLSRCGRNATGHVVEFGSPFEDCMKLAAMMAACGTITNKSRDGKKYISFDPVDPRQVILDPTGRGLYRIKETIIDKHELMSLARLSDKQKNPIYKKEVIEQLQSHMDDEERKERERLSGSNEETTSTRQPIVLHEYLCDLIDTEGNVRYENHLFVVANKQWLIRGPEKNPWWHQKDWLVYTPAISVPLSVYGKSYMEDWAKLARTFNELTNLIIDAVHTNSINAFVGRPSGLEDPSQLDEGIFPNVVLYADEDENVNEILKSIELGSLPGEALTLWQALKKELQEGALFSEIALGQLSTGEKTATEISESSRGSSTTQKGIAKNIESNFLEPVLDLLWKSGLQHLDANDTDMKNVIGEENFKMFLSKKKEFVQRQITFRVQAISGLIERNEKFKKFMSMLQIISTNELLMKTFVEKADMGIVLNKLFELNGMNVKDLQPTPQGSVVAGTASTINQRADAERELAMNAPPRAGIEDILSKLGPLMKAGGGNGGK